MLPAETLGMMAERSYCPSGFAKKNKHGVPTLAMMNHRLHGARVHDYPHFC